MKKSLLSLLFLTCWIQARATTLSGTLKAPDGSLVNGILTMHLSQEGIASFAGSCGGPYIVVPTQDVTMRITNGVFPSTNIIGNDCISPANTYYVVSVRNSTGTLLFREAWTIQGTTQDIGVIVPTVVPSGTSDLGGTIAPGPPGPPGPVGVYNGGVVNAGTTCTSPPARPGTGGCNADGTMPVTPSALGVGSVYATGSIFDLPSGMTVPVARGADCYDQSAEAMGVCNEYNDYGHAFGALAIFNPLANTTHNFNGHQLFTVSKPGNTKNIGTLGNVEFLAIHQGSGTVANAYGFSGGVVNFFNAGNITQGIAVDAFVQNDNSTGTFGTGINYLAETPFGPLGTVYGYYAAQMHSGGNGGSSANYAYYAEDQGSGTNDWVLYSLGGKSLLKQGTNGLDITTWQRQTDTSPTGNFWSGKDAAGNPISSLSVKGFLTTPHYISNSGTPAITVSAGWGSTSSGFASPTGNDQSVTVTLTANGAGIAANPTINLTFAQSWTATPGCVAIQTGGTGAIANITVTARSTTVFTFQWNGTPVAGSTYEVTMNCMGR
jgi:hypothetical protein